MKLLLKIGIVLLLFSCHKPQKKQLKTIQLLHQNWEFSQEGKEEWNAAQVPGVVHLDLLKNDLIDDPYWEDNELKQQWIEAENWEYRMQFSLDQEDLNNEKIELNFKGLDTYARVFLNDQKILMASNMFRSWRKEVKPLLKKGKNELRVVFESPIEHNKEWVENSPHQLPSGNETEAIETKVAAFSRKAAYQFGWDWGPRFVTSGIWRPIELIQWNQAQILDVYTSTLSFDEKTASLQTEIEIEASEAGQFELLIGDGLVQTQLEKGINIISHQFEIKEPKLWWANGSGEPHLYSQKVQLLSNGALLDSLTQAFGVRSIELVNEADSIGTSFYFKLNGKAVFMKGANYIPQDVFLHRVKPEQYENLIAAVKGANMNMIRVWGGGIYEKDLFYELCDRNGILVWQDFMFAGSLYPEGDEFRENVKEEAIENIKRLRKHPCLALWCGNNEIEVAWKNWGWQKQYGYSPEDSIAIWNNYLSLFHQLLPDLVEEYHSGADYTPTSPLSNWGTAENFNHSSMHYWGVWHGKEPFEAFEQNVGRFMVEYGFQSFPAMESLQKVIADSNLQLESPSMQHRQKSYIGNGLILQHVEQYYETPKSFEDFVNLSQEVQAKGMRMAIRAHLQKQPHCMGSLFWQLNDCWPGPSWSVIDYYGNKKVAYEAVKEEFATQ